jgi:hypothetical protein
VRGGVGRRGAVVEHDEQRVGVDAREDHRPVSLN